MADGRQSAQSGFFVFDDWRVYSSRLSIHRRLKGHRLRLDSRARTRYVSGFAFRNTLALALMLSLSTHDIVGQQDTNNRQLPDAPSATKTKKPQSDVVNLLAGRSRVLPNLAVNTRPMTDKEKFSLAIYNALSPVIVVGAVLSVVWPTALARLTYPSRRHRLAADESRGMIVESVIQCPMPLPLLSFSSSSVMPK